MTDINQRSSLNCCMERLLDFFLFKFIDDYFFEMDSIKFQMWPNLLNGRATYDQFICLRATRQTKFTQVFVFV